MLVPGDDPPFVKVCFDQREVALRRRDGRELVRRLEELGTAAPLVARLFAAQRSPYPKRFVPERGDEAVLLEALDLRPAVGGRLSELREAVAARLQV